MQSLLLDFKAPAREYNSKPLAKIRITRPLSSPHTSHCKAPSLTWSNLAYSFLPPTRKGMWPTPHLPIRCLISPQSTSKCMGRPHLSSTNQQVGRCVVRPLLSLLCPWAIKTDKTTCLEPALPDYQEVSPVC